MTRGGLRLRLLLAGAVSIVLALSLAGTGLYFLFQRHVERRIAIELESHLRQLVSGVGRGSDGALRLSHGPAEPRFAEPLSGLYWQVTLEANGTTLRSRSLWDVTLILPGDADHTGEVRHHVIAGPNAQRLFAVERTVVLPKDLGGGVIRSVVAVDRSELEAAAWAFVADLLPFLAVFAVVLLTAGWLQVTIGLKPLDAVRGRLADIRAGRRTALGTAFPDEVLPMAVEVDLLLAAQESAIGRARARAADLAHALRTPLTVLQGDAEELRARGEIEIADEIALVADGMRRTVERELARSRAGARISAGMTQPVRPAVERIVAVLHRLPAGRILDFEIDIAAELCASVDAQDLTEMLGNLGENAAKWARERVLFSARRGSDLLTLVVEDDGPGISPAEIETVLCRGGRLPQAHGGSGLGLAIVGDLVEAYGGAIALGRSALGGLRVELALPLRPLASLH